MDAARAAPGGRRNAERFLRVLGRALSERDRDRCEFSSFFSFSSLYSFFFSFSSLSSFSLFSSFSSFSFFSSFSSFSSYSSYSFFFSFSSFSSFSYFSSCFLPPPSRSSRVPFSLTPRGELAADAAAAAAVRAVAGARGADLPDQMDGGAAYVFTQGVEEWEQQKLVAPDGRDYTSFGRSVAIRGNMILVGADGWGETAEQENTGRVYIFTRDMVRPIGPNGTGTAYCGNGLPQYEAVDYSECVYGRNYSFYQVLVPFDRDTPAQRFGVSLSLSDFGLSLHTGILAVGAYEYSTLTAKQSGRVYIYKVEKRSFPCLYLRQHPL